MRRPPKKQANAGACRPLQIPAQDAKAVRDQSAEATLERYTPLQQLGKGSTFGSVLLVNDNDTGGTAVWKRLRKGKKKPRPKGQRRQITVLPTLPETHTTLADFLNEVRILNHLSGSGVAPCLLDYWQDKGSYNILMSYAAKYVPVRQFIDENKALICSKDKDFVLKLACNAVNALYKVHDAGVAHRDIKPDNMLIDPETLDVQFIDFGLACSADGCAGQTDIGTNAYRAPELNYKNANWNEMDRPSNLDTYRLTDYYSLGVTLMEILLGEAASYTKDDGPSPLVVLLSNLLSPVPEARAGMNSLYNQMRCPGGQRKQR